MLKIYFYLLGLGSSPAIPSIFSKTSYVKLIINIKLVNDYLFRALLQKNNRVLKGLIASLLHMEMEDIQSVIIKNEIILGKHIPDKAFILDIRVLMNDNSIINLEMQVVDQCNWVERSMSYLCRCFDNLAKGDDYINAKPVVQIGLLDYTLFPDAPEFYASYYLMNENSHKIYSDKLRISVVDLTHIDLATDEDKLFGIDHWAIFSLPFGRFNMVYTH